MDVGAELVAHGAAGATGRLDVAAAKASASVVLREGRICSVSNSAARPALGMRLVSGGCLSMTNLGSALNAQMKHPGMRLGDVLVRMGLVQRRDVEAVAWEQMCDDVATILGWRDPTTTFTPLSADRVPPAGPTVGEVFAAAEARGQQWQRIVRDIGGPDTVPGLSDEEVGTKDMALRPTEWAVLCRVDGSRSLQSIADQAGFTTLEAASIIEGLIAAGLVTVPVTYEPHSGIEARPAPVADQESPPVEVGPSWQPAPIPPPTTPAPRIPPPAAERSPQTPPPAPPAPPAFDEFDDPADLLRELSQLGGPTTPTRRGNMR